MRTMILKKVLRSLYIFINCVTLIYTSACNGDLASTAQKLDLVEAPDIMMKINPLTDQQPMTAGSLMIVGNKRKDHEGNSIRKEENSVVRGSKRPKVVKRNELPITSNQAILVNPLRAIENENKIKAREAAFTRKEEIRIAKGSKHLKRVRTKLRLGPGNKKTIEQRHQ